jgi:SAM-dependent methyltransferase
VHASSYEHMTDLVQRHLDENERLKIIDIGSYDVNGSYRTLFKSSLWSYVGIDLSAGPGVDIALSSPYEFPLASESVDLVISGQAFEHVEYFWQTWMEMLRVLRPGGRIFLIAPSRGPEHRYPQDCWRFYPDGYRALASIGNCELLEVSTDWEPHADPGSSYWGDTVGVFRKRKPGFALRCAQFALRKATAWHGSLLK